MVDGSVLYHSLLGLASVEKFWDHLPEVAVSSNCHRLRRFLNAIRKDAPVAGGCSDKRL
jgi:hypothetical protein